MRQALLLAVSLSALQATPSESNQQWLQAREQLNSFDSRQRLSSVKFFAAKTEDEETAQLLRDRLLVERSETVLSSLLDYFDKRRSREDFFYLLDFIPLAPDYKLAGRATEIMATIHAERTRKEFSELLEQDPPHLLMAFLAGFPRPDSAAREVCRKALSRQNMRKAILLLPPESRKETIGLLQPYAPFDLILPEKDITSVLLLTDLREYSGGSPSPDWFHDRITANSSLERQLALEYLDKQARYAPQRQNLRQLAAGNSAERYFALRQRLFINQHRNELTESLKLIATPRELLLSLLHGDNLTTMERSTLCAIQYRSNMASLDNRLSLFCEGKFINGDISNLGLALRQTKDTSPRQLYRNLTHTDSRYRLKAVLLSDERLVSQHRDVFKAMLLKEPNRRVRFHLGLKLTPPVITGDSKSDFIEDIK